MELEMGGPLVMHLVDGREGEFVPMRGVGGEFGAAVMMVRGMEPLRQHPEGGEG